MSDIEKRMEELKANNQPLFSLDMSRNCEEFLDSLNMSLAITTYQAGKILFLGIQEDQKIWVHNRNIGRCLGMTFSQDKRQMICSSDAQVYSFSNVLQEGQKLESGIDALYVPQYSNFTGDLDMHDMALDKDGNLIFVNTLFNCVAKPDQSHSFVPVWKPPFISQYIAEDRCHLNGIAMKDGELKYASCISETDTFDAWRSNRTDGGIIMDVANDGEIVASGLSMPHSPRYYRDKLWVLNSGKGEFGFINKKGKFEEVAFCPGYLRGLDFHDKYAFVGLSLPRDNKTFSGLPLDQALSKRKIEPQCGIYVIDLEAGNIVHWFKIEGVVTELYDINCMAGVKKPAAISPLSKTDIQHYISVGEPE